MEIADLRLQESLVLWCAFATCMLFGAVAQRTHFCTMGAISDVFNIGSWIRMRMWGMAIGVAMLGFYSMVALDWIDPTKTIYFSLRVYWLSALVGGALFGIGMVLASGCASKTLVRIGEGSLKSIVVFFIMGLAAYASMRGLTAFFRARTVDRVWADAEHGSLIPLWAASAFQLDPGTTSPLLALLVGGGLIVWALANRRFRSSTNNLLAGVGIGASVVLIWWVIGRLAFVAEHPQTLEATYLTTPSGRIQALSFTGPMARTLDWGLSFEPGKAIPLGMALVLGVIAGSFLHSLYSRTFQWEGFQSTQDTALHIVGAILMGIGGVTAAGCTVGQGLSGISTLNLTSVIALAGILLGGVAGLQFQRWLLMRE